ncbi:MAG: ATP-binding protein [Methylococcales bacterium]
MIINYASLKDGFRDASIRIKLTLIIGMAVILALMMITMAIITYEYIARKQQTERDLSSVADIVSWNSSAALAFMDMNTAAQNLKILSTQPSIVAAFLYTPKGEVFAEYKTSYKANDDLTGPQITELIRDDSPISQDKMANTSFLRLAWLSFKRQLGFSVTRPLQSGYSELTVYDDSNQLHLLRPIFIDNELVGTLHLVDDQRNLDNFFSSFYLILGFIVLATLLAALFISTRLQRIFSSPLLALMQAMKEVAHEKNFTSPVVKTSHDEFGQLVDVYNDMLEEIHQRDEQLEKHREGLELLVKKRTTELSGKNLALEQAVTDALLAKEEAEAANHAKSQFLANMSHEIRTPMNAVLGMTEFLYESELTDDQRHSIEMVQQSSRLLLGIINDILDFSKIESGKLELDIQCFNCHDLVHDSFGLLETQAKNKGLQYRLEVSELPDILEGDSIRMGQILMNLLSNAVKFTAQGEVLLRVTSRDLPENKVRLHFEITDTGIGIDTEKQQLIFDAFSQADNSMTRAFGGTGLGLAIAKQLVRLMGGDIGVISQTGHGATFWFWVELQKSHEQLVKTLVRPNCRFTASILVAEDYPANQILVQRFLTGFGCQVTLTNDGTEAISAFKEQQFDLIFMDCQMPVMDGYQAATEIRRLEAEAGHKQHIPIIALTAHALTGDRAKCLHAGMDEWVTKPFTRQDINEALQKWLPEHLVVSGQDPCSNANANGENQYMSYSGSAIDVQFLQQNFNFDDPDDLEFIGSLKHAFQQNAAQTLSSLQQSINAQDAEQIRKLAHGFKSISANVGGMQLSSLCKSMEQLGQSQQLQEAELLLKAMEAEYQRVLSGLQDICSKQHDHS